MAAARFPQWLATRPLALAMTRRNLIRRLEELEACTVVATKQVNLQFVLVSQDGTRKNGPLLEVRIPPPAPKRKARWR